MDPESPVFPTLQVDSLSSEPLGKPKQQQQIKVQLFAAWDNVSRLARELQI